MSQVKSVRCCICFFNDTATTEIYTLSLHDALPISATEKQPIIPTVTGSDRRELKGEGQLLRSTASAAVTMASVPVAMVVSADRKSTRLNSSHANISYAVFCLKKKKHSLRSTSLSYV